uniref:Phosphoinositide phospholipase C n=1 Tax=Latimeria chalumnae TaxID=7897 RepID=H3B811_LATCH
QHKSSVSRLAEDFFWIGGSIIASPHWRIGQIDLAVERCMSCMQSGTQMVKLRGGSKGLVRFYYLDDHKSCIRWRPSRKNEKAKISIDVIREVCEGKQSEIFQRYADGSFDPNCCFSIYYGDHMESLDLVSSNGEEARTWITGLKYLMAGISDEDSLSKRQRTRDQWLKQTFSEADKNGDGSLSISEVLQLMHKLNVNLPRQKVKQMFKEADTDDNQGTLGFEEFCAFYKMMSTRRDLYLLLLTYSNHKEHLDTDDIIRFLEIEQKMIDVTKEHCLEIINKFEPCPENQKERVLGIDGFTNYMRSPAGDIFNPEHYQVNQDMTQPLCNYYIASSHNTYLMGDQLMSQSRVDMYAWVLQAGCRCVEVDCWDGPDGEPIVHHGYTLTSKILFRDVIETINKYAFVKNEYPIILSIENHCSVPQQKKMAQYLVEVLGDKLDLSSVNNDDSSKFPSPKSLKSKILVKGKKLPANISADAEEGDVSDEDSADEIDDDCKLMNGDASVNRKLVENVAKKKLDSLLRESKIRDREDPNNFTVTALPTASKLPQKPELKKHQSKIEEQGDPVEEPSMNVSKRHSRSLMGSFSKRKKKMVKVKKASSLEMDDEETDQQGNTGRRISRQKKTMKLSRALSDLVKYTKSVGTHDVDTEVSYSWQVSSFSETKAHQILQQKPNQFIRFNQHQLSRIYPSSYRVDSSNYNPQPFWNAGCQLVALNYQSEGRVLQLNRAKFSTNGNCGYVLKPKCMCQGAFNPISEDPLPGQLKKQLVLRLISGQQLPKPRDSMLGDRGETLQSYIEKQVIVMQTRLRAGQIRSLFLLLPAGFNPMWEETLVFTLHMPEIALVRFLVWDHDPIGRDFIGQRTIAFSSMIPFDLGYRHVYLEGMEEASIFVHIAVNDITGKARQVMGLKGLFLRNPKQASLDSHAAVQLNRKHSFSSHLLRRTASAPTKGQQKSKKGFPEIAINAKDNSSEGASEERESEDSSQPRFDKDPESGASGPAPRDGANGEENLDEKQGVFARCAINGSGRIGVASNCMKCVIGCKESPDLEPKQRSDYQSCSRNGNTNIVSRSIQSTITTGTNCGDPKGHWGKGQPKQRWQCQSDSNYGSTVNLVTACSGSLSSSSSSLEALGSPELSHRWAENSRRQVGTLQREMNALFLQKMEEIRSKSPIFFTGKGHLRLIDVHISSLQRKVSSMQSLETIFEESVIVKGELKETGSCGPSEEGEIEALDSENCSKTTKAVPDPVAISVRFNGPFQENNGKTDCAVVNGRTGQHFTTNAVSHACPHPLVRRAKSEGHVVPDHSALTEVYSDVTNNDRIWSKLDNSNHRDSMSSSSSMSSNDTVIDLSLPNLARKSLTDLDSSQNEAMEGFLVDNGIRPRASTSGCEMQRVSKSKSNPNLRSSPEPPSEGHLRPLDKGPEGVSQSIARRHTWNRLYIEGLKKSSPTLKTMAQENKSGASPSKSKSLGDLTSDDIMCNFEGKYKSISRSFVTRSMREQRRPTRVATAAKSQDDLTAQLKRLTSFEEANDITSPTHFTPIEAEEEGFVMLRRSSSRSQSRVRYIANRAKQAQERQRLQQLAQMASNPIEERGNPEGACTVTKGICID